MPDQRQLMGGRARNVLGRLRAEESGMTLIEVLVAATILLVALVPTVSVFDDTRDQNATGERHEIALLQAEQALEEMRGLPYSRLVMNAGAVDPGGSRLSGTSLKIRNDLSEPLVYYTSEGVTQGNAWVDPVSQVTTGSEDAPVDMTVYRFVTWRDEECGVADLSDLGVDLPTTVSGTLTPLLSSVTQLLTNVLGIVSNSPISALRTRLTNLRTALNNNLTALTAALDGISEVDLCDVNLSVLTELQELGDLNLGITGAQGLIANLTTMQSELTNLLNNICLPLLGCPLSTVNDDVLRVNNKLTCIFGNTTTAPQFNTYLTGVVNGLNGAAAGLDDTQKNTKRITAAVVIEPRDGSGPYEPVWATSVVRNPEATPLGDGTSC